MAGQKFSWDSLPGEQPQEAGKPSGKFDWNSMQSEHAPAAEEKTLFKNGAGQAALEGAGNALTYGYLPHLQAGAERGLDKIQEMIGVGPAAQDAKLRAQGFNIQQKGGSYVKDRDENIRRQEAQKEQNPTSATIGAVAGSLVGAVPLAEATALKGAGWIGRALNAGAVGGAQGLVANPGDTEGKIDDSLQIDDRMHNAKMGAAIGGAGSVAGDLLSAGLKGAGNLAGKLKNFAEDKSFKATGAMLKDFRKANGEEGVRKIGRWMLDNGLIKPGASYDDIAKAAAQIEETSGKKIGDLVQQIGLDESLSGAKAIEREGIAKNLEDRLLTKQNLPGVNDRNAKFQDLISEFRSGGQGKLGVAESEDMKREVGDLINWKRQHGADIPDTEQFHRALYDELKNASEAQADKLGDTAFKSAKQDFGTAKKVNEIATDRVARESANRLFSASDYGTGLMGAAIGASSGEGWKDKVRNGLVGGAVGVGNKFLRSHGNPIVAQSADKLGDFLARNPNLMGQFARPAVDALSKNGVGALAAASFGVNDPSFTKAPEAPNLQELFDQPKLMQIFKDRPDLVDSITDDKTRDAVKERLGRMPADQVKAAKGEDKWMQGGAEKLGLSADQLNQAMQSKETKRLLIEASDLPAGSPRLKQIMDKIQKGSRK